MNANAAEVAPLRAPASRAGTLETLLWLVRRELWEHRALWIAPLALEAVLAVCLMVGQINLDVPFADPAVSQRLRTSIFTIVFAGLAQPVFLVAAIVVGFYLLDALYAERRDRSILFWKSLPVSDELTVASKFAVAAVVVPLGALVLVTAGGLLFSAIMALRVPGPIGWNTYEWLRTELVLLLEIIIGVLWYAPIAGALLVFSAWVRKGPVLWATLVPVVAPIVERIGLGTHYIWKFEAYRMSGIWHKLGYGHESMFAHLQSLPPVGDILGAFDFRGAFTDLDLWLGVIAAVALAYTAARIRRFRDES